MMDGGARDKFERNWEKCRKSFLIWPTFDRNFDLQMGKSFISFNFMYFFMMKVQLFKTIVRSVLMYGCEAWKLTKTEAKLDGFQYKCMKRILRIRCPQTISHQQLQENTGVIRTSDEIRRRRWNWIGHKMRKDKEEHCITALEWRPEGKRRPGQPKTTWRRNG